ncbi:CBN-CEH-23 protein [Caenorhabditis brenneri]|uniref:CBN-CEH-23 protein n=1 Tax=Caenorhabditis brenneri TaxID=135651 RepID=G0MGJ8_CAEBE|nr:CBN-CEH-23 protein [Caenorhabditis brenneri]
MDTHQLPFHNSALPVSTASLTDVLQTILQACPTSSIPSTSTAILSPNLTFPATIPSVNLFPPPVTPATNPLSGIQALPVRKPKKKLTILENPHFQTFPINTSLLQATPSGLEALANLFATTSRRASCPEPPATSQATVTLQVPASGSPERRRYSETSMEVLIREQLAQMMPPTAQLPGMPGCYYQHGPAVSTSSSVGSSGGLAAVVEQARINSLPINRRAANHRKARTIYGTTQTQQLEDMFRGQMYVVGAERENLAARLGLSPSQVRIWFQNRRSKHRRKQQEEQASTSSPREDRVEEEEEDDEEDDDVKVLN